MPTKLKKESRLIFHVPGVVVDNLTSTTIASRRIPLALKLTPNYVFAFQFCTIITGITDDNYSIEPVTKYSELYYIDAKVYTLKQVKNKFPKELTLIDNMKYNNWSKVIHTRCNTWKPWTKKVKFIKSKDYKK